MFLFIYSIIYCSLNVLNGTVFIYFIFIFHVYFDTCLYLRTAAIKGLDEQSKFCGSLPAVKWIILTKTSKTWSTYMEFIVEVKHRLLPK